MTLAEREAAAVGSCRIRQKSLS